MSFHGDSADDSDAFVSTVTIADHELGSEIVLRSVFPTKARRDHVVEEFGAIEGGRQTLGRLAAFMTAVLDDRTG